MAMSGLEFALVRERDAAKTQSELALLFDVSARTVKRWEKSALVPPMAEMALCWLTGHKTPPLLPVVQKTFPDLYDRDRKRGGYMRRPSHPGYGNTRQYYYDPSSKIFICEP